MAGDLLRAVMPTDVRRPERTCLLAVPTGLALGAVLSIAAFGSAPALTLALCLIAALLWLPAVFFPYTTAAVALWLIAVVSFVMTGRVVDLPNLLDVRYFSAALLLFSGIAVAAADIRRTLRWQVLVPVGLALLSAVGYAVGVRAGPAASAIMAVKFMAPEVATLVGAVLLAMRLRGRLALLGGLLAGGITAAVLAIVEFLTGYDLPQELAVRLGAPDAVIPYRVRFGIERVTGAFDHPILLGVFLGLGILAVLYLMETGYLHSRAGWALCGLLIVGQMTTLSRGPIAATILFLVVWAVWANKIQRTVWIALLVAAVLAMSILGVQLGFSRLVGLIAPSSDTKIGLTAEHRVNLIADLPCSLVHSLPFGKNMTLARKYTTIDNEFLYLVVEHGAFGLAMFLVLLLSPPAAELARRQSGPATRFVLSVALYLVLAGLTVAYFGIVLVPVWAIIGLLWGIVGARAPTAGTSVTPLGARTSPEQVAVERDTDRDLSVQGPQGEPLR